MSDALKKAKIFIAFGEKIIIKNKKDMFKHLAGLAFAVTSVQAIEPSDISKVQCQSIITSSGTVFDITAIENDTPYEKTLVSTGLDTLQFNYCTTFSDDDAYAVVVASVTGETTVVADDPVNIAGGSTNLRDADEKVIGLTFTQSSDEVCGDKTYSMTTNLVCDEAVTAKGGATI